MIAARPGKSPWKEVRRVAARHVEQAEKHLDDPSLAYPEQVHELRKSLKRARAALRLLEVGGNGGKAGILRHQARDIARVFALQRDRDVLIGTLREIGKTSGYNPESLDRIALRIEAKCGGIPSPAHISATLSTAQKQLKKLGKAIDAMDVPGNDTSIREAVAEIYGQAAKQNAHFLAAPTTESLHELRKRVKELYYTQEMLGDFLKVVESPFDQLEALADLLGECHDLDVLAEALTFSPSSRPRTQQLVRQVETLAAPLKQQALGLARKLFQTDPDSIRIVIQAT